jgi:hypothetical protein
MTHNDFDFYEDLIRPLMQFLVQSNILTQANFDGDESSDCSQEEELYDSTKMTSNQVKKQRDAEKKAKFIEVSN